MRVLVASEQGSVVGGVETYLSAAMKELVARGHAVAYLHDVDPDGDAARVAPEGITSIRAGELSETMKRCRDWRPDVVYQNAVVNSVLSLALASAWPSVALIHGYGASCISGLKRFARPALVPCTRRLGAACLACYFPRRCGGSNPLTMFRLYRDAGKKLTALRGHDLLLVTSRWMFEEQCRNGFATDRIRQVPFGSGSPRGSPRTSPAAPGMLLFLGRLIPQKGALELVRAVAHASRELGRRLRIVVGGKGPEREAMEALARSLGIPARFEGWVDEERRAALFDEAQVLVVPSLWPEPFGLVGIEAAYAGVPTVGFAIGGITEWLLPGVTGEVAPGERPSAEALGAAIARALRDPEHLAGLGKRAWEHSGRFTLAAHVSAVETAFHEALEKRARPEPERIRAKHP